MDGTVCGNQPRSVRCCTRLKYMAPGGPSDALPHVAAPGQPGRNRRAHFRYLLQYGVAGDQATPAKGSARFHNGGVTPGPAAPYLESEGFSLYYGLTWTPWIGPFRNPYYGGFGHFETPSSGFGYLYPAFTWPFLPTPGLIPGL